MRARIVVSPAPLITLEGDVLSPRILSASSPGTAQVALVGTQMVLLAGDSIGIDIVVGAGCTLEIVEPVGTVAYGGDGDSEWDISIEIADGGTLIWQGQPFVISDDARVRRSTRVKLGTHARLLQREILTFGRSGQRGGDLVSKFHASSSSTDGEPLLIEDLDLSRGRRGRVGVLSENRVLDSIIALGWRPTAKIPTDLAAFDLAEPGTMVRRLGSDHDHRPMDTCWQAWYHELVAAPQPN